MQVSLERTTGFVSKRSCFALVCVVMLQACGGGSGGGSPATPTEVTPPPPATSSTAVTTSGVITAFGSVYVNGVEYETDSAEIESDDEIVQESDLKVGQIVTLTGTRNDDGVTGSADRITYNDRVEGPISSIDGNTLVVLGQTIIVDADTVFDDNIMTQSLSGLSVGDVIEVSGFLNSNGDVVASFIEYNAPGGEFELVGTVTNLDANNSTFEIGSQVIDFSGAILEDFGGSLLEDGNLVEVKGSTFGASGELIARKVELETEFFSEDHEVEVEGLISRFESESDFDVFGRTVTTTSTTEYKGGLASDLAVDVKVEVEGSINSEGVLVAEKVEFKKHEDTRIKALVDSIDPDLKRVVVLGLTIVTAATTQLEDDSDVHEMFFNLDSISVGDFLEVRGKLEDDGTVTATRLERDNRDDKSSIRGSVQSNDGFATLVIAGVTIQTSASTQYRDSSETNMTQAEFFAAAIESVQVKAKGLETNTSELTADELELENHD